MSTRYSFENSWRVSDSDEEVTSHEWLFNDLVGTEWSGSVGIGATRHIVINSVDPANKTMNVSYYTSQDDCSYEISSRYDDRAIKVHLPNESFTDQMWIYEYGEIRYGAPGGLGGVLGKRVDNKTKMDVIIDGAEDTSESHEVSQPISDNKITEYTEDSVVDNPITDDNSIIEPVEFYLGESEIEPGEFVVISVKNVDDISAIAFTSEPDIGFNPTFFVDGNYARALVPVPMEFEENEIRFICSYGEVSKVLTLDIRPREFGDSLLDMSATVANQTRTETTIKNFNDTMAPIIADTEPTPLWEGIFHVGTEGGIVRIGFGRYCTISSIGETFRHCGCDYVVEHNENIMAMNNGKVVYVGYLDYPGYMVVIDHGLGLKSWYCHLSAIAVKVGDLVNKGDVIGYAGGTGFAANTSCHIAVSVYDVPVCQYSLWDEGVVFGDEVTTEQNQATEQNNLANSELPYDMALLEEEKLMAEIEGQLSSLQNASHSQYVGGGFVWPVSMDFTRISSQYGGRVNPRTGKYETHPGVDIPATLGESITASNDGTVIAATYHDSYGNYIVIDHGGGYATLYAHCSKLLVSKGDEVEKGQTIAEIGSTGALTDGNLLHFAVFEESKHTDPMNFFK